MADSAHDRDEPSGYPRLDEQIHWYDTRSLAAQRLFKFTKTTEIVCAALVPLAAHVNAWAASALGAAVLVLESVQQLNQWQQNWNNYRSTCENLRHEKYSYLARTGPYDGADPDSGKKLLAERVERLISTEHTKWVAIRETAPKTLPTPRGTEAAHD